jgi:soluble lytic murein transglycosylase-like protein
VRNKKNLSLIAVFVVLASLAVAQAAARTASPGHELIETRFSSGPAPETESAVADYRVALVTARKADAAKAAPLDLAATTPTALKQASKELDRRTEAKRKERRAAARAPSGPVAGVSQATLDAIASCESGGDPTAVNAGGYYGKYQFDLGTWASVGGSGNPADASEGEQDYRASLLYSRAGASPWPVCGQ